MSTIEKLRNDPRVESVWSEAGTGDGYWVMLKSGFADLSDDPWTPTHTIHEWTWSAVRRRMRDVKPCACNECAAALTPGTK